MKKRTRRLSTTGQIHQNIPRDSVLCLLIIFSAIIPYFSNLYDSMPVVKHTFESVAFFLGLTVAILGLWHSGEVVKSLGAMAALAKKANDYRESAEALQTESNKLQIQNLALQMKINQVRLYARVHLNAKGETQLVVSNLSGFDLWINRIELHVTEVGHGKPGKRIIGGGHRISIGNSEEGYLLYGNLIGVNSDRNDSLDMKFYVEVNATGLEKDPVKVKSPLYRYRLNPPKLEPLEYW